MHTPQNPDPNSSEPLKAPESNVRIFGLEPRGSSLVELDLARGSESSPSSLPSPDDVPTYIGPRRSSLAEAMSLAPGYRLSHFEVIEALGSGGMAAVLKARDTELGRVVALKILPPETTRDAENITRFKQEARAAARLDHENIARVFFCGEDRGLHFIAFEFVEGQNLRVEIDRLGTIPPVDCVRYMLQVSAGLAHAAERGVVHRDIKPSNIIVMPDGRAKIIDMGLARHHESASVNGGVTHSGVTLGTFDYISPEQALDPRRADVRSDIYSLGCAFYHALTGRPPVPEGTAAMKLQAQQNDSPVDPRLLNSQVPDGLAVILSKMMAKNPSRRYQTPAELIADLSSFSTTYASSESSPSSSRYGMTQSRQSGERWLSPGLVIGLAAAVVGIVITIGATSGGRSTGDPFPWRTNTTSNKSNLTPLVEITPTQNMPVATPRPMGPVVVDTVEDLVRVLQSAKPSVLLRGGQTYDFTRLDGIVVSGQPEVSIECLTPDQPATVRIAIAEIDPEQPGGSRPGSLTFTQVERVRWRGVRLEIVESTPHGDTVTTPAGVVFSEAGRIEMRECRVEVEAAAPTDAARALAVFRNSRQPATVITVGNSYFHTRRWSGIDLVGEVKLNATECGFSTSRAAITLGTDIPGSITNASVELHQSTFLLDNVAAAVENHSHVRGNVSAGLCVFAAAAPAAGNAMMMMMEPKEMRPAVVRGAEGVNFTAFAKEANVFYRVEMPASPPSNSVELRQPPWAHTPPTSKLAGAEPWKAFELNTTLRPLRDAAPTKVVLLGAQFLPVANRRIYDQWPPPRLPAEASRPGVRIWWPNPPAADRENLPRNVYDRLDAAITDLRPGEEIHIRANGLLDFPNLAPISRPNGRIVLTAEEGSTPTLVLPRTSTEMFRLDEGELRLESLDFIVRAADADDDRASTVVALASGRRCTFVNCSFTLEEKKGRICSVATIIDPLPANMKKLDRRPEVVFEQCLLRGSGRAVRVPSGRPVEIEMTQSATALSGPVIEIGPVTRAPASGTVVSLQFTHLTALLDGPLIELQTSPSVGGGALPLLPVEIRSDSSLYAPIAVPGPARLADRPAMMLIRTTESTTPDKIISWQQSGNAFANTPSDYVYLDIRTLDGTGEPRLWNQTEWLKFAQEKPGSFGKGTLAKALTPRDFATLRPDDLLFTTADFTTIRDPGANTTLLRRPADTEPPAGRE